MDVLSFVACIRKASAETLKRKRNRLAFVVVGSYLTLHYRGKFGISDALKYDFWIASGTLAVYALYDYLAQKNAQAQPMGPQ